MDKIEQQDSVYVTDDSIYNKKIKYNIIDGGK